MVYPNCYAHVVELQEAVAGAGNLTDFSTSAGVALYAGHDVPNVGGFGDSCKLRMTSCGVTVTYAGTELNRAGEFVSGNAQLEYPASGVATTGTQLSPLSTILGKQNVGYYGSATLRSYIKDYQETRVGDRTQTFYWLPNGVPSYFRTGSNTAYTGPSTTTAGALVTNSIFASSTNSGGPCYGENALLVMISGDVTGAASITGNVYDVQVIAHWEVIPSNITAVTYDVSPSLSDPMALAAAMNACSRSPGNTVPPILIAASPNKNNKKRVKSKTTRVMEYISANRDPIIEVGTNLARAAVKAARRRAQVPVDRRLEL